MSDFVHPDVVRAFKRERLGPALHALLARVREARVAFDKQGWAPGAAERDLESLLGDWAEYDRAPIDWLSAPAELARGLALEARLLRLASGAPGAAAYRVGELLGMHTVANLRDLLASRHYVADQLSQMAEACTDWPARDPAAFAAWRGRLQAAKEAFAQAAAAAQERIDKTPEILRGVFPAGDPWDQVLRTSHPFVDLDRELRAKSTCAVSYAGMPAPTAGDPDLALYNWTGDVTARIDAARAPVVSFWRGPAPWLALAGLGGVLVLTLRR